MSLLFRQLFDSASSTYSYLLAHAESNAAVLIDPVYEQHERDLALIRELDLNLICCIDTHCHADHVTGAWLMKHHLMTRIAASTRSGITGLDDLLGHGEHISFGEEKLEVRETPGHTAGCISLVSIRHEMIFTGDCLLIRGCGRTDFQQGSAATLFGSIRNQIFNLPDNYLVYPAHDYNGRMVSTVGEEKKHNPRIGGQANETDFIQYMDSMDLPHPGKLDIALPANLVAGKPADDQIPEPPHWAPVTITYSGAHEVSPQWVATHRDEVHILDVRTTAETLEESSSIADSQLIPLNELRVRIAEVSRTKPIVTICRSGRRSVLAFNILKENGWQQVANIQGGLLRWTAEGLPLDNQASKDCQ